MWLDRSFRVMNTGIAAWLQTDDTRRGNRALDAVERFFLEAEWRLSRFRSDSEISTLNRERRIQPSRMLLDLLRRADAMRRASEGVFNALSGASVIAAGYDRTFDEIGPGTTLRLPLAAPPPPTHALSLAFHADGAVSLPEGALLDLGGIAKGWAADRSATFLGRLGPACVDAGGDIRVAGAWPDGAGFTIDVEDPFRPESALQILSLSGGGVATSGIGRRWWRAGGEMRHHLIDPRTGQPADNDLLSVTVQADTTVEAEVAAKTAFILGEAAGRDWLAARGMAAVFVMRNGAWSSDFRDTLLVR
ncbi:MAG: FAD:protein FMN transferase [Thermoflexales bacterium]